MKKRLFGVYLSVMLISVCVGCGGESTSTEQTEVVETPATEESTPVHTTEQTTDVPATPKETEEPHTHNYAEEITVDATCEADGLKTFTCECGDTYTEVIPAAGHVYENYVSNNDATYTADGTETAKCNTCELTDSRTAEGSKLEYTYTEMNATMYATQTVNVRNLPNTDGEKIGSLSTNQEITVLGQCNETSWYQLELDGQTAFVSNSYLSSEKVEDQQSTGGNSGGGGNSLANHFGVTLPFTATSQFPYPGGGVTWNLLWNSLTGRNPDVNYVGDAWDGTQVTISDLSGSTSYCYAYVTTPNGTSGWMVFYDGSRYYVTW